MAAYEQEDSEKEVLPQQSAFDIEAMLQAGYEQQAIVHLQVEQAKKQIKSVTGTIMGFTETLIGVYLLNGGLASFEIKQIRNVQF